MLPLYFLDTVADSLPRAPDKERVGPAFQSLSLKMKALEEPGRRRMEAILAHPQGQALLAAIFAYSPFLTRLTLQHAAFFAEACARGVEQCFAELERSLAAPAPFASAPELMKALRLAKSKASLLIAMADIAGVWTLEQVTEAMSQIAELCVRQALRFLLAAAARKGEITLQSTREPEKESGIFVLAMGKLGARELNYSSDIDLIVFFDGERARYTGNQTLQQCFSKLTQEMVYLLQERTGDGYVFRVDLRLRPDPSSTPAALSTTGAITYYETVGQNWERAAFIKARPIAGDIEAGYQFLKRIAPFLWRKHLDFAAIADIQSIKRQMDAQSGGDIELPGHNIKTGVGGIREIEFFAQLHQLIWGGRILQIRSSETCMTLLLLAQEGLISADLAGKLSESYRFLRMVEHRLQMIDDQQTHSIPVAQAAREQLAAFAGFAGPAEFERTLLAHLHFVHRNFSESFRGAGSLGNEGGTLSFTGVENDPETLKTLRKMGYLNAASVSEIIQGWHRGMPRATRTKRARELITELTPTLLKAFAATREPDQAFLHFDEFLSRLPGGVQLFSMFANNPQLLDLIAQIMGSAPAMAATLSKNPNLLDTVLTANFYRELPAKEALFTELSNLLLHARDFEDEMDIIRRFKNEKQFQAGVQLILRQAAPDAAARLLSDTAETCLEALLHRVETEFAKKSPKLAVGGLAAVALGRLGAREMTFGSDIDLVFVYDTSARARLLAPKHELYNKLCQRYISAITSLTREGRLYEVDTRLRPSGMDGALAVSLSAFAKYFREKAWTFEFMALTRARPITGNSELQEKLRSLIAEQIRRKRERGGLIRDILDLRARVTQGFGSDDPWNLKYAHGGLMDMNFIAQYFVLLHAHAWPDLIGAANEKVFSVLVRHGLMEPEAARELTEANQFINALFALLRLCGGGTLDEAKAPAGLKHLLAASLQLPDFDALRAALIVTLATVRRHYAAILDPSHDA